MKTTLILLVPLCACAGLDAETRQPSDTTKEATADPRAKIAYEINDYQTHGIPELTIKEARTVARQIRTQEPRRGLAYSDDAQLFRLHRRLQGMNNTEYAKEASELWVQARTAATRIPPSAQGEGFYSDGLSKVFDPFDDMRQTIEDGHPVDLEWHVNKVTNRLKAYESESLGGEPSARGRAILAEAKQLQKRLAGSEKRYLRAVDRLNANPRYGRLRDETNRLQQEADNLAREIGMSGYTYELACNHHTQDYRRLCALTRKIDQVDKQINNLEGAAGIPTIK